MNIQTDRALLPEGNAATRYLVVTITAPEAARRTERPALNVALVLDRSGSMAGRKIDLARQAVAQAIAVLDSRDRLAVVCYDQEIDTLLASTPASAEAKTLASSRLREIDARGSTNLDGGWRRGSEEVRAGGAGNDDNVLRRVLLLSDGLANHGETNIEVLAARAAELRARGVMTSTFGIGADFDEVLMSRLATDGGGHFYFIEQPAQIPDILTSELGDALDIVARDARLVLRGGAGIEVRPLTGYRIESREPEVHVRLGDMVSQQQVTIVVAVRCDARAIGTPATLMVRLTDRDSALFPQPMTIEWETVSTSMNAAQPVNVDVLVAAGRQIAAMAREEAVHANRHGDFTRAGQILAGTAREIRALAAGVPELDHIASELEGEEEQFAVALNAVSLKERHFASYSVRRGRQVDGKVRKA